jgi:hypothetical protein
MTGSRKAGATYLRAIAEHGLKFPVARGRLNTCNSSSFQRLKRLNTGTMSVMHLAKATHGVGVNQLGSLDPYHSDAEVVLRRLGYGQGVDKKKEGGLAVGLR